MSNENLLRTDHAPKINTKNASKNNIALKARDSSVKIGNAQAHVPMAIIANQVNARFSCAKNLSTDVLKIKKKTLKHTY